MTSSFIGCILTCTFLCICLNIGFLYVIFEQKRSCDRVVAELEFELEGYFQRRISNDFADSLHVPSHKQPVKNQPRPPPPALLETKKLASDESVELNAPSLSSNKSPAVKEKPPLSVKKSQSPKEEREMLKQFAESIPDAPEPHLGTTEVPEFEESKIGHVPTIKSAVENVPIVEKASFSGIIPDFLEEIPPESIEPGRHFKKESREPAEDELGIIPEIKDWQLPEKYARAEDVANFRTFEILIQPKIHKDDFGFAIMVYSELLEVAKRRAIRETYGSKMKEVGAAVFFHLGRAEQPVNNVEIQIEAEENNDIVQHDIKEHAYNKTLVSLMSLKWYDKILSDKTPVVILSDSRTYIDMTQWSETIGLGENKRDWSVCSQVRFYDEVQRKGKFGASEEMYKMIFFPTYCQAGCFGLSRDVVKDILAMVPQTRYFYQPQKYISGILRKKTERAPPIGLKNGPLMCQHLDDMRFLSKRYNLSYNSGSIEGMLREAHENLLK
ncbi:unnamed protein product [Oikopleura dioica]|uniref:Hexosyltransferase n=1 Tax=Oikopleura dioica TaxID=34765 RepID=E4YDG8_OIKDI|nr:unnamed protein product [Oikopleura dioica]